MGPPTSTAPTRPVHAASAARRAWADNVRIWVIIGMIVTHVATAYLIEVDWYYMERTAGPAAEMAGWGILAFGLVFGMGLLFLVAGLFTPGSLARKGPRRFAVGRLLRLGVPLAVFVFVIDLLTDFAGYRGMRGTDAPVAYVARWWREDADLGPAWFIAVLLAFSLVYAAWRAWRPAPARTGGPLRGRVLLGAMALIAVATFGMRLVWPFLSGDVFGLTMWELPQMAVLFSLGVLAAERGWLDEPLGDRLRRRCGAAALVGGVLVLALVVAALTGDPTVLFGGLHPAALAMPTVEAVVSVAMSVWALEWFRRRWDHAGPLGRAMGRSSYAAYLAHPPVVVALGLALRPVPVPAEAKFVVVAAAAVAGAFAVGWLLTRWRALARVL